MFAVLYCESDFPDSEMVFTLYPAWLTYYLHKHRDFNCETGKILSFIIIFTIIIAATK